MVLWVFFAVVVQGPTVVDGVPWLRALEVAPGMAPGTAPRSAPGMAPEMAPGSLPREAPVSASEGESAPDSDPPALATPPEPVGPPTDCGSEPWFTVEAHPTDPQRWVAFGESGLVLFTPEPQPLAIAGPFADYRSVHAWQADGTLLFLDGPHVRRLGARGQLTTIFTAPEDGEVLDGIAVAPGRVVVWSGWRLYLGMGGRFVPIEAPDTNVMIDSRTVDEAGTLHLVGSAGERCGSDALIVQIRRSGAVHVTFGIEAIQHWLRTGKAPPEPESQRGSFELLPLPPGVYGESVQTSGLRVGLRVRGGVRESVVLVYEDLELETLGPDLPGLNAVARVADGRFLAATDRGVFRSHEQDWSRVPVRCP